jgi:60 kDa SS-A/Ro ribonucleoprotein
MAQTNVKTRRSSNSTTHEGARAMREAPIAALSRVLMAHMLFEDSFYLDGKTSATALGTAVLDAVAQNPAEAARLIVEARTQNNIRHASLFAAVTYAQLRGPEARALISATIQRADEMAEVIAMAGVKKAPHAVLRGVKDAFEDGRFDAYQFGKYKGTGRAVTLLDALRLSHPSPAKNPLVQSIYDGTLAIPNTWETRLSAGEDAKTVFRELLAENRLGAMALLRNLRKMTSVDVPVAEIVAALGKANWSRVLPFRFMSAMGEVKSPTLVRALDDAFDKAVRMSVPLAGKTAVLVDHSGSMDSPLSERSTVCLRSVGNTLAAAVNGDVTLIAWATRALEVKTNGRLSGTMNVRANVGHSTNLQPALDLAARAGADRVIVISDMQFADTRLPVLPAGVKGYMIDIGPYPKPGLASGNWVHITGFSTAVLKFIAAHEADA